MDQPTLKRTLRREVRDRILALTPDDRRHQEAALIERFPTLSGYADAGLVLLYARAFPEEIDTRPLLALARDHGKRLALPRVDRASRSMTLHAIDDPAEDLRPGTLGIPEPAPSSPELSPEEIDWVLAPGLAFDSRGFRLGRGAGHYDRLLAGLRPDAVAWALALAPQWLPHVPTEPHDRPLHGVALPDRVVAALAFGAGGSGRFFR